MLLVLLSVASPSVVTYASQVSDGTKQYWLIAAIFVSAIAGAATSLQAIFGFGEMYRANAEALINLKHLGYRLKNALTRGSELSNNQFEEYSVLKKELEFVQQEYFKVEQGYIQGQVRAVLSADSIDPQAGAKPATKT